MRNTTATTTRRRFSETELDIVRGLDPSTVAPDLTVTARRARTMTLRGPGESYRAELRAGRWMVFTDDRAIGDAVAFYRYRTGVDYVSAVKALREPAGRAHALSVATPQAAVTFSLPRQTVASRKSGRDYLIRRGITPAVLDHAEACGALSYSPGAVVYVGRDAAGIPCAATRRWIEPRGALKALDVPGSAKAANPMIVLGDPRSRAMWIVEGGTDALAVCTLYRLRQQPVPTTLATGGAHVRQWLERPDLQALLRKAEKIIIAFERESSPATQASTDAAHARQIERVREIVTDRVPVDAWRPPPGVKDVAERLVCIVADQDRPYFDGDRDCTSRV